jgi:opacity protein-like surface antigen
MANGYRDFDTGGAMTPFVTFGLGVAQNTMSEWTRINPDAGRTRRSFEGDSDTGLAWSVGAGVSSDVGPVFGSAPAKLEVTWRYFDLGSVTGGTEPLPGSGAGGNPVEALNFDVTNHVLAVGLRIPM